jgi:hypothetical protein
VALEEAIVGSADVTFASGNVTLTLTDTNASQTARNLRLNLVGTTAGARDLIVPAIEKVYIVNNGCADAITVKNNSGTGIAVPAGKTMYVYNNGTNVLDAITHLTSLTLGTPLAVTQGGTGSSSGINVQTSVSGVLPVANGGTGSATATFSGANITALNASSISSGTLGVARGGTGANTLTSENVVIGNGTSAVKFVAPGTTGNVLTSNGSAWLSQAAAAGGGDYIMQVFTTPGTWTKAAGLKAIKVTVIGGGGSGSSPASGGGTSSFGSPAFLSATGGASGSGPTPLGAGGSGSGGQLNALGQTAYQLNSCGNKQSGGSSAFGFGQARAFAGGAGYAYGGGGSDLNNYGGGGGGGAIEYIDAPALPGPQPYTVGAAGGGPAPLAGAAGVIIVEEFY